MTDIFLILAFLLVALACLAIYLFPIIIVVALIKKRRRKNKFAKETKGIDRNRTNEKAIQLGTEGEAKVAAKLGSSDPLRSCYVINDYFFKSGYEYCQIDHLLINPYGVFVLETKNYSGWIYGNDADQFWTQTLNFGKEKHRLYNPIKQNAGHMKKLAEILPHDVPIAGRVVFVQNNAQIDSPFVCNLDELQPWLEKFDKPVITPEQILEIINCLRVNFCDDLAAREKHVRNLHRYGTM